MKRILHEGVRYRQVTVKQNKTCSQRSTCYRVTKTVDKFYQTKTFKFKNTRVCLMVQDK